MNTKALYYPSIRMGQALHESRDLGQSRIEITYTAPKIEAEKEFFKAGFASRARRDLDKVEVALNNVSGLVWHLPLSELLE